MFTDGVGLLLIITSAIVAAANEPVLKGVNQSGIVDIPHPKSCKKFYRCQGGKLSEMYCAQYSYYFDTVSNSCVVANKAHCADGTDNEKLEQPICADDGKVKMVPHQSICTKYYLCMGSAALKRSCQGGMMFDADSHKCNDPSKVRCHVDPWCPEFDQLNDLKYYPDLENCANYAICFRGNLHYQSCADGLFFNVEEKSCTKPRFADCKVNGVNCHHHSSILPHPVKCNSYYQCISEYPFYRECDPGKYFDSFRGNCVENTGQCLVDNNLTPVKPIGN